MVVSRVRTRIISIIRTCTAPSALVLIALLLTGCVTVGPDYALPETSVPQQWSAELEGGLTLETTDVRMLVAWWSTLNDPILTGLIERAIRKRGFGVVEVISHCPTQYGKKNGMGGPVEMLRWQKDAAVRVEKAREMSEEDLQGKFTIGMLVDRDLPIYIREYRKVREAARARVEEKEGRTKIRLASGS